jgi:hypothetical protein
VSEQGGKSDLGDTDEELFESGKREEGAEKLEGFMDRLDHVQAHSCYWGDRRGSCHASVYEDSDEDSDDGGAKL